LNKGDDTMSENSEINEQKTEVEDVLDEKYHETQLWPSEQEDDVEGLKMIFELSKYHYQLLWELTARYNYKFGILIGLSIISFIGTIYLALAMPYNLNIVLALGSSAIALILGLCGLKTEAISIPPEPRELAWVYKGDADYISLLKRLIGSFSSASDNRAKNGNRKRYFLDIGYMLLVIAVTLIVGYIITI